MVPQLCLLHRKIGLMREGITGNKQRDGAFFIQNRRESGHYSYRDHWSPAPDNPLPAYAGRYAETEPVCGGRCCGIAVVPAGL